MKNSNQQKTSVVTGLFLRIGFRCIMLAIILICSRGSTWAQFPTYVTGDAYPTIPDRNDMSDAIP